MRLQSNQKYKRVEARVSSDQKDLFQYAANLSGKTLSDFMVSALGRAARQVIEEHDVIHLSLHDQNAFAQAIFNPPKPSRQLLKAATRHQKAVKD